MDSEHPAPMVTASASRPLRMVLITFGAVLAPRGGMSVRCRAAADALVRLGHSVTVIGNDDPAGARRHDIAGLRVVALRREPFFGFSPELVRVLRAELRSCDLLVVESAMFYPAVAMARPAVPVIWDTNECESLHYRRLDRSVDTVLRWLAWRGLEGMAARRSDIAVSISAAEDEWWRRLYPRLRGRTMLVEHAPFIPDGSTVRPWSPPDAAPGDRVVLFVGNLVGKQNLVSARWLLENVAPALPEHTLLVLAGQGTDTLVADAAVDGRVRGLGAVDDIDSVIAAADLCVAPVLAGAGVKTKVLHYLAHGRPVLVTPEALEGIEDAPGVVTARLDGFVDALLAWLSDDRPDDSTAGQQREWLSRRAGPAVVARQWGAVLERIAHTREVRSMVSDRPSIDRLATGLRREVKNWATLGPLAWLVVPSRLPPRRGLVDHPVVNRLVTVRLRNGDTLRCHLSEFFAVTEIYAMRVYDIPEIDLPSARTILDVGANIGAATLWMARHAPSARVIAVEPLPQAVELLRANVRANGLDARVRIVPAAVGAVDGTATIDIGSASVNARVGGPGGVSVDVRSIDGILAQAGVDNVDVIKIDCEGAEYEALAAAGDTLRRTGAIVGEYHAVPGRSREDLLEPLQAAGFSVRFSGDPDLGMFVALRQ